MITLNINKQFIYIWEKMELTMLEQFYQFAETKYNKYTDVALSLFPTFFVALYFKSMPSWENSGNFNNEYLSKLARTRKGYSSVSQCSWVCFQDHYQFYQGAIQIVCDTLGRQVKQ